MNKKKEKTKILLLGEQSVWGIFNIYVNKFKKMGHIVDVIDLNEVYSISFVNRVLNWLLTRLGLIPVYFGSSKVNGIVLKKAEKFNPDLIIFFDSIHIFPETVKKLKKQSTIVFSWNTDAIFYNKNISRPLLNSIPVYDCHFTINSSCIPEFKKLSAKRAVLTPPAAEKEIHFPTKPSPEEKEKFRADIVFVGTYANDNRSKYLERLCKEGYDVKVYGNRWDRCLFGCSCLKKKNCLEYRPVYIEEMSKVFNSSKIILSFLRAHNKDKQTTRTYEIPATKSFMLHERTDEATDIFKEGKEAEFFEGYDEMKKKIDYYLNHSSERKKIAENGYKRVQKHDCTYDARAEKIMEIYYEILRNKQK